MAKLKELIARREQLEDTMAQFERMTVSRLVQKTQLEILDSDDSDDDISDTRYDGGVSPSKANIGSLISKSTSVSKETDSKPKTATHISKSESKHSNLNSTGKWDYESSATPPQYKLQVRQIYVNFFFIGFSIRARGRQNSLAISCQLTAYFSFGNIIIPQKAKI